MTKNDQTEYRQRTDRIQQGSVTDVAHRNVHLIDSPHSKPDLIHERLAHALTLLYELLEEYAPSWYTQKHHEIAEAALNDLKQR